MGEVRLTQGLERSVSRIKADKSRDTLGDGTGVIVGIIDSGIDDTHPSLRGNDSLGRPRLVAERNFVPREPGNTGDDLFGHGTAVAGVILGRGGGVAGIAPDARYVNARVLDARNLFDVSAWPENAVGFALQQHADVLNLSLNFFASDSGSSSGVYPLDKMLDWVAFDPERRVLSAVCVGNVSGAELGRNTPRSPAGAFNVLTIGQTNGPAYIRLDSDASYGVTGDGRTKPDLVAPGTLITTANFAWEQGPTTSDWNGCSFATPHVTGVIAQMIDYGRAHALSTDPLVLKSIVMTGAEKILNSLGKPWAPHQAQIQNGVWETVSPLDPATGAGQIDALAAAMIYRAGPQPATSTESTGWQLDRLIGEQSLDHTFHVQPGVRTTLDATLTWMRHSQRIDDGDGVVGSGDSYDTPADAAQLDNLDLILLRNQQPIARSISTIGNVEHLHWMVDQEGEYTVRVERHQVAGSGTDEMFSIAWTTRNFRGDLNGDSVLGLADVDQLSQHLARGGAVLADDLNGDSTVDLRDLETWVIDVRRTYFGDANLDGQFSSADLTAVFQAGLYEDIVAGNATWGSGDWNADLDFTSSDLIAAFQAGGYELGPRIALRTVPEPVTSTMVLTWTVLCTNALRRCRRFYR